MAGHSLCVRREKDRLPGLRSELTRRAHRDVAGALDRHVEEGVAADMLGDRDDAPPLAALA